MLWQRSTHSTPHSMKFKVCGRICSASLFRKCSAVLWQSHMWCWNPQYNSTTSTPCTTTDFHAKMHQYIQHSISIFVTFHFRTDLLSLHVAMHSQPFSNNRSWQQLCGALIQQEAPSHLHPVHVLTPSFNPISLASPCLSSPSLRAAHIPSPPAWQLHHPTPPTCCVYRVGFFPLTFQTTSLRALHHHVQTTRGRSDQTEESQQP